MSANNNKPKKPTNFSKRISDLSKTKKGRNWGIVLIAIVGFGFPALFLLQYFGIFAVFKPTIDNEADYIGYYKVRVFVRNDSSSYEFYQTNATLTLFDYYDDHLIANITADGTTVYQTTNVTMGFIAYIDNIFTYPNSTVLIRCNKTIATAYTNDLYITRCGNQAELDATIYMLNDTYGNFGIGDIYSANFTIGIQTKNLGNGTFGYNYYIPEPVRRNVNCTFGAMWLRVNKIYEQVIGDGSEKELYYDELGNTYICLYTVGLMSTKTQVLQFIGSETPTEMKIIQGQFDGTLLKTF